MVQFAGNRTPVFTLRIDSRQRSFVLDDDHE